MGDFEEDESIEYLSDEEADVLANAPDEYEEGRQVGPEYHGVH